MHIVYFHPDKPNGYGATHESRWPRRLKEQGLDVSKGYIVQQGLTLEQADQREIELQVRDGYKPDSLSYKKLLKAFHSKKSRDKKSKTYTGRKRTEKEKASMRGKPKTGKGAKGQPKKYLWVPVIVTKDGTEHKFNSIVGASKKLNVGLSNITGALAGRQKTAGGYKWRYATIGT